MVLDCLDGLHARRTGQTSRVGEVLDHWLDGLNTPLNTAAMVLTLGLDPWTATACMASLAMSYGGQLIVWHHTGRFLCSPTCGVEAQFLLALSFVSSWGALAFGWICILACLKQIYWFARQAPSVAVYNIRIGLLIFAIGLLYPFGMFEEVGAVLVMGLVSFRVTGSYVLYTVLGRRYEGLDWITLMWIPVIVCVHLFVDPFPVAGTSLHETLPYVVCLHVAGATVFDLVRHFGELRFMDERV
jgi:phosphatidylglycerophosphate synthase